MANLLSKQLTAAILADFAYQYNKRWNEDWRVDVGRFVEIYRPGLSGKWSCDGNFIDRLFTFCKERLNTTPCLSCFDEQIRFYL